MRYFYVIFTLVASVTSVGCYEDEAASESAFEPSDGGATDASETDAGGPCIVDSRCGACARATRFESKGLGDAIVICSDCDGNWCGEPGDCKVYGAPCYVGTAKGACAMCCNGPDGHLTCSIK